MPNQKTRKPADPSDGPVAQFGYDLRMLRQKAGLTYAGLARSGYSSKSALHAADQGHKLPSEVVTESFVTGCGEDAKEWLDRRAAIASATATPKVTAAPKPSPKAAGLAPPDPTSATTKAEYVDAIKRLRGWAGMSLRDLQRQAESYARPLPSSTVSTALKLRDTLPPWPLVDSVVRAVGLDESQQRPWKEVWEALEDGRPVRRPPAWRRWQSGGFSILPPWTTCESRRAALSASPDEEWEEPIRVNQIRDWVLIEGEWRGTNELAPQFLERTRSHLRHVPIGLTVSVAMSLAALVLIVVLYLTHSTL